MFMLDKDNQSKYEMHFINLKKKKKDYPNLPNLITGCASLGSKNYNQAICNNC